MIEIIDAYPFVKVIKYLALMEKNVEKEGTALIVKEKVEDQEVRVKIIYSKPWIRISLKLGNINEFPEEVRSDVLRKLLNINYSYAEVSFGVDDEGNILAVEDILEDALTLDLFEEEYGAVPFAVNLFKKEIEPLKKK